MTAKLDFFVAASSAMKTWADASAAIDAGLEPTLAELVRIRASRAATPTATAPPSAGPRR